MKEALLTAILNLLALISSLRGEETHADSRQAVSDYLNGRTRIGDREQYLALFDELFELALMSEPAERKRRAWQLCDKLMGELPRPEQLFVALNLMNMLRHSTGDQSSALQMVFAAALDLDGDQLDDFQILIESPHDYHRLNNAFLVLDQGQVPVDAACRKLNRPNFKAQWTVLEARETGSLFLTTHSNHLSIDGHPVIPGRYYLIQSGSMLRDGSGGVCYYAEIQQALSGTAQHPSITFIADNVNFRFPNSYNGLHNFTCHTTAGKLIGVMGGSGAGKSTLLSILSGSLAPQSGHITINGVDLYGSDKEELEGMIGLVPQDDLLFEDLTVEENLTLNARLCLPHLDPSALQERVEQTLKNLHQLEIRHLKVGSPLQKSISGGQRKRLNIALELIREPSILFADEPTSGLSSSDSLNVMSLLKQQALAGRLVIAVIHQPASDAFKLLDQLWVLDQGGRPVFVGHPLEAISYFQRFIGLAGADEAICPACGSVEPGQIFEMLEMRAIDERGHRTEQRQMEPEEWHQRYLHQLKTASDEPAETVEPLTEIRNNTPKPSAIKQFSVFFQRTLMARLANHSYLAINLLQAPLLALLLGGLTYHAKSDQYLFVENDNIPGYFFMSVVVAIFLGLSLSAEEIVRDRSILKRESFLGLSWLSYINAKLVYLMAWMAGQMMIFILITHYMLEIQGLFWQTWLLLFMTGLTAILIGLNISASFRSVVAIYILLPLLLLPQMMLGGSVIPFNKLISGDTPNQYVPWFANIIPARWSYEALLVQQYTGNHYQKTLWNAQCQVRELDYLLDDHIPEIRSIKDALFIATKTGKPITPPHPLITTLQNELAKLSAMTAIEAPQLNLSATRTFGINEQKLAIDFLQEVEDKLLDMHSSASATLSTLEQQREAQVGNEKIEQLRQENSNNAVNLIVYYGLSIDSLRRTEDRIVQLAAPICQPPESKWLMAPFGAGSKQLGTLTLPTLNANLIVLGLIALLLYLALALQLLPRLLGSGSK